MAKKRLDVVLQERYPQYSRVQIQSWIMQGKATIDTLIVTKPGTPVADTALCQLIVEEPRYVSRAGFKLERALEHFAVDVMGYTVLDAGLSTGGFTDCLLQKGAVRVYGVDVGYGQVHEKIRSDARVVVMERVNVRTLAPLPEPVDLVTLDLSFISVLKVIDAVLLSMKPTAQLIVLIKPQFEAAREDVGKKGIIRDPLVHKKVIDTVVAGLEKKGFQCEGVIDSPLMGATGNKEFLGYFQRVYYEK